MAVVGRKHWGNIHRLGDSSHLPLAVSFSGSPLPFVFEFVALAVASAVVEVIDLKNQLCIIKGTNIQGVQTKLSRTMGPHCG